jgi:hypothetical protein
MTNPARKPLFSYKEFNCYHMQDTNLEKAVDTLAHGFLKDQLIAECMQKYYKPTLQDY